MAQKPTTSSTYGKPEGEKTTEQRGNDQKTSTAGKAGGEERSGPTEDNKGGWEKGAGMNKGAERTQGASGAQNDRDQSDRSGSDAEIASDTDTDNLRDAHRPGAGRASSSDEDTSTPGGSSTSGGM